ncbi:MAG: phosphatase [Bacteroidetes bacterium]|jgi:exopolyphosphatase/guanosine-5'-triphosphate,3'-diphosphate pyrophosphatase|nr:phosphatase [Bacteroidota bacterium]MCC6655334.1 phosphatase [Flavobacteriales bacterium]HMU14640.1 hypothetical protein [Flavobacteriales bacterium]HNI06337.1 hypothetical protein [Flavobacteriales bacterium]
MRFAIIDLGTNTFNLLVAEHTGKGALRMLHEEECPVFLGRGSTEKGIITDEAMERALVALRELMDVARSYGAACVKGFGTSALRSARNATDLSTRAKALFDLDISVITGEQEAELILAGVRQAVSFGTRPMLVMDIGGGSIEFILATDKALMWKRSFELGATRLLERFTPSDPLTIDEQFRLVTYLDTQLEPLFAVMDRHWPAALVGSAGSFDTLAELVALERGDTWAPDQVTMTFSNIEFDAVKERIIGSTRAERVVIKAIPEYRVDTLPLALIAMERVIAHGIEELRWSRYALKEGAAVRMDPA